MQDIFLFLTFRFCRDWEFGATKTQAQHRCFKKFAAGCNIFRVQWSNDQFKLAAKQHSA
jgi:hypothetical protein